MSKIKLSKNACARIPTKDGEFTLCLYRTDRDDKEHLALVMGDVSGKENVLVRAHSECFTGDVLGSKRCDCGEQLHNAMAMIAEEGRGIVLYLRQEGRGIGLEEKLKAYNLQDEGFDTVDANLLLGHQADERDYTVAAEILRDIGVRSVRLLTNNLSKVKGLESVGIKINKRISITGRIYPENESYLRTKVERMSHIINLSDLYLATNESKSRIKSLAYLQSRLSEGKTFLREKGRPFITVSYAQSVDGSIASSSKKQMILSGQQSLTLTHHLRAAHDAILIGIETVLSDDPRLTVRLVEGENPQPVILDSRLRMPLDSRLLNRPDKKPWLVTTSSEPGRELEKKGVKIIRCNMQPDEKIDLPEMLQKLGKLGITSIMVEGGSQVISSFVAEKLVDQLVITVTPSLIGGLQALSFTGDNPFTPMRLGQVEYQQLGEDLIIWARPIW